MGRVGAPFGIKGWIKVQPYTESLDNLFDYDVWQINQGAAWQDFEVEEAAIHGDGLIAKLARDRRKGSGFRPAWQGNRGQPGTIAGTSGR